jgi:hypothetical protein
LMQIPVPQNTWEIASSSSSSSSSSNLWCKF